MSSIVIHLANCRKEIPDPQSVLNRYDWSRFGKFDQLQPDDFDCITEKDGQIANKLGARVKPEIWKKLCGQSIAPIKHDWDLIQMSDDQYKDSREITTCTLKQLPVIPGLAAARLTKGLHRKRPNYIPVCDSRVLKYLCLQRAKDTSSVIINCMDSVRSIGLENRDVLKVLQDWLAAKGCHKTSLRILDILMWSEQPPSKIVEVSKNA